MTFSHLKNTVLRTVITITSHLVIAVTPLCPCFASPFTFLQPVTMEHPELLFYNQVRSWHRWNPSKSSRLRDQANVFTVVYTGPRWFAHHGFSDLFSYHSDPNSLQFRHPKHLWAFAFALLPPRRTLPRYLKTCSFGFFKELVTPPWLPT